MSIVRLTNARTSMVNILCSHSLDLHGANMHTTTYVYADTHIPRPIHWHSRAFFALVSIPLVFDAVCSTVLFFCFLFGVVIFELAGVDEMCAKFITYIEFVCVDNSNCLSGRHRTYAFPFEFHSFSFSLSLSPSPFSPYNSIMIHASFFRISTVITRHLIHKWFAIDALKWNSSTRIKHFLQEMYKNSKWHWFQSGVDFNFICWSLFFCYSSWWVINNQSKCFWWPSISRLVQQIAFLWAPRSQ